MLTVFNWFEISIFFITIILVFAVYSQYFQIKIQLSTLKHNFLLTNNLVNLIENKGWIIF